MAAPSKRKIIRVWVADSFCSSHGACINVPEVLTFPGTHYPVVTLQASDYFDSKRAEIIDAAFCCPTRAIFVEFDDGLVITSDDYGDIEP